MKGQKNGSSPDAFSLTAPFLFCATGILGEQERTDYLCTSSLQSLSGEARAEAAQASSTVLRSAAETLPTAGT